MRVALASALLEDDVYEKRLDNNFMENVICQEDHFYHRIAKTLTQKNVEAVVYYMSQEKELAKFTHKYGHAIIRVPAKRIPFFHEPIVFSGQLPKIIGDNFDICHFVSGYYVMYKIPDMFDYAVFKLHNKMPIIARWAGGNYNWLWPIRRTIKKKSLQKCDRIICSSREEMTILQDKFGIKNEKISFLLNPIDLEKFKKRNRDDAAKKIGLDPGFRYLLFVGRLTQNKGVEQLLQVFNSQKDVWKDLKLVIIGDGPLLDYVVSFVKDNSLENRVILKGRLTHDVTCYYYNVASVLINIGLSGGLANVIIESIASGLPVITTDTGASKEYVNEHLKNGILIEPNNYVQLSNAITEILDNENNYKNQNQHLLNEFSMKNFGEKLIKIYEDEYKK
jgi:glycosyltransferase involved in cell wall biosynthesis